MGVLTFEGIVEEGRIRLNLPVQLPDNTRVYVVVPDIQVDQVAHIYTPRLVHPEQMADFKIEIVSETS